jgi:glycosyltransferase involved in cell wall biosynthesis
MDLSVIVPLYNEEDCVTLLYEAIVKSVDTMDINA